MKVLDKKVEKIMQIMSWTHTLDDIKRDKIKDILSDIYELGHADGYADGVYDCHS
jgi:hypothetical protein